jgi:hypothetical protein
VPVYSKNVAWFKGSKHTHGQIAGRDFVLYYVMIMTSDRSWLRQGVTLIRALPLYYARYIHIIIIELNI